MWHPLLFSPIFKERVWGGRELERLYQKPLPPGVPVGESWEISDHGDDLSVVRNGPLAGQTLRELMMRHGMELLGRPAGGDERFPLLIKILDARDRLSLQVHPPAEVARKLGGEPKTEMWFITDAAPEAELFAGLRAGVSRETFERKIGDGSVAECFHRIPVSAGDALFLPSGRVHAIGAGMVLFEVQQNSDTTYRVFDWNRMGLDGKPRALHVPEAMASIDFNDFEPSLIRTEYSRNPAIATRYLVNDPLFSVDAVRVRRGERFYLRFKSAQILGIVEGRLEISGGGQTFLLQAGEFALLPAALEKVALQAPRRVTYLHIQDNSGPI